MVARWLAGLRARGLCQWSLRSCGPFSGPPPLGLGGQRPRVSARTTATLSVQPAGRSLCDEPLRIAARGLAPEQPVTAAVIINGSVAAVGGTIYYKDESVPPVTIMRNRVKMTEDGIMDIVDALKSPLEDWKSFIPVERSDTAFLFLVGEDDHNWKSEFYANEASKRLEAHGKKKPQIICYPETGHYIEVPYIPLCKAGLHSLVGAPIIFGGQPRAHAMAQVDVWKQLQAFFHKHLGSNS
uniref:BAAT/Acyl-CoA thioester hydrolase C-terminal domain-containing protein n=1 Tax=Chinchilla lanigera TaxID=34839 RepID=A0A8C2YKQ3_CHILA